MKRKANISIIGPIGDIGGRELETGFIVKTLIDDGYNVHVTSTLNYTDNSQLFDFVNKSDVSQLNSLMVKKSLWLRFWAYVSYIRAGKSKPLSKYCSNAISRKIGYKSKAIKILKTKVDYADVIVLCAQISSAFVKEIVEYCFEENKPVVIRTSSMIIESDKVHKTWLNKVSLFIHHSESNASRLSFLKTHNYKIIDQCTFKEDEMLALSPTNKFKSLLFVGRLSPEKGILEFVDFFKHYGEGLDLTIIGTGDLQDKLELLCKGSTNIQLKGFVPQQEIVEFIKVSDAIIIPSIGESGPLVGLEAMASARLIISTKVGAMPDRLKGLSNQFWFNIDRGESFKKVVEKIRTMIPEQIETIALENRKRYLANYNRNNLENVYKSVIFSLIKTKQDSQL